MRAPQVAAALAACLVGACGPAPSPGTSPTPPTRLGASCPDARLLASPADLADRGPWPVGATTVQADDLTLEIWYPAVVGSDRGRAHARYDLRTAMPPEEAAKIPDADNVWLPCDCVRELPLDATHGPYPVVMFLHGAASFRAQSAFLASHWASRGFVVVAPELPGVGLAAVLGGASGFPVGTPLDVLALVEHAPSGADPLAAFRAHLDPARVALAGHSLGAVLENAVADQPAVAVRIAMAGAVTAAPTASVLVLGGDHDHVAGVPAPASAQTGSPARVGVIHGAGHLAFSDLCGLGADRGGALAIARAHGVAIPELLATLATDGCHADDAPFATTAPVIRALTTGVLEERLRCDPAATRALATFARDPRVAFTP